MSDNQKQLDEMRARMKVLREEIGKRQDELSSLERTATFLTAEIAVEKMPAAHRSALLMASSPRNFEPRPAVVNGVGWGESNRG